MTKKTLLIAIPTVAIVLNGVGYLIFLKTRSAAPTAAGTGVARPPASVPPPRAPASAPPAAIDDEAAKESQAQAGGAAGLVALEAGEYDKALINFTEAKALIGDKANVADLLRVTEDLRRHPAGSGRARGAASEGGNTVSRKVASRARRAAPREETPGEAPAAPAGTGLLIVTTSPRGLLVHVDDAPIDLTPMKTKVKPGSHRVSLLDGDRKVYETTVEVREGGTATLLRDLTAEAPRPPAATPAPVAPLREEVRPSPPVATAPPAPSYPQPLPAAGTTALGETNTATTTGGQLGTLEISSPGLYGVVWVNGRPRGYPPLAVRDLPAGPVKVEVRVNGVQKRVTTAVVKPGSSTTVKLRSSEASR